MHESGLNQSAVSPAGAIGIMQLMPATAASLGVDPHDPIQNIQGGVMLLAQLLSEFAGDVGKALAAYNWHPDAVSAAVAHYGSNWLSHAPSETQSYVASILANVSTEYSVSAGTPAASFSIPGTPVQAGSGSGISLTGWLVLAAIGFVGFLLLTVSTNLQRGPGLGSTWSSAKPEPNISFCVTAAM